MPRLVCLSFCVPTRAVWTVEIWSSPARQPTLWPGALADSLPACARAVCVRGTTSFTHGLLELLSAVANNGGEVVVLLAREQAAMREELATAFDARGVLFEIAPLGEDAVAL